MPFPLRHPRFWLSLGWGLVLAVVVLSLIPMAEQSGIRHLDKIEHALAYFAMTAWFCQIYPNRWRVGLAFFCLGGTIELLQGWLGFREMSLKDQIANSLGVLLGMYFSARASNVLTRIEAHLRRAPAS
jgi:VanZ family protein